MVACDYLKDLGKSKCCQKNDYNYTSCKAHRGLLELRLAVSLLLLIVLLLLPEQHDHVVHHLDDLLEADLAGSPQ